MEPTATRSWYAYILKCGDGSFYVGSTCRLTERVAEHQAGRGARYTRWKKPVVLAASFSCQSRREAQQLEAKLKRLSHCQKEHLVSVAPVAEPERQEDQVSQPEPQPASVP